MIVTVELDQARFDRDKSLLIIFDIKLLGFFYYFEKLNNEK